MSDLSKSKAWLDAFRLRTLPLAAATVFTGAIPAIHSGQFDLNIFLLVLLTTFSLQILSNLANDYGDFKKGTDNANRLGPMRTLQGGFLTARSIKRMIVVFTVLSLCSGIALLFVAMGREQLLNMVLMLLLGGLAIWAAVKYTVGKNAFGYMGLGDVFVFFFFGLVGVCGTSFLMTGRLDWMAFILSFTPGLLATGVLNVNNMRDVENDKMSGKNTLVVRIGLHAAKRYHLFLIVAGLMATALYLLLLHVNWGHVFVFLLLPLFILHLRTVFAQEGRSLDVQLKRLSLSSFVLSLLHFVLSLFLS